MALVLRFPNKGFLQGSKDGGKAGHLAAQPPALATQVAPTPKDWSSESLFSLLCD